MRQGIVLSNSWAHVGAMLANADAAEQAIFFKGLAKEMFSWNTDWARGMQLMEVSKLLTDEEKDLLGHLTYKGETDD